MTTTDSTEALVAVVRPSGQAMFHTQDCPHAGRAISALYALPEDFAPTDVCCSRCLPGGLPTRTDCGDETDTTSQEARA